MSERREKREYVATVIYEANQREYEQSWTLHSGELVTLTDDAHGIEITGAVEPDGLHLLLSVGDAAELVLRLTEILHRRLPIMANK